jgi:hypothetical protein
MMFLFRRKVLLHDLDASLYNRGAFSGEARCRSATHMEMKMRYPSKWGEQKEVGKELVL